MNANRRALIFSSVWPEPSSSAAGVRQMQWIRYLLRHGYQVTLSSPAKVKSAQDWGFVPFPKGVELMPLPLNQSKLEGKHFGAILQEINPQVVVFDRFILEEQFGHWVYEYCPNAKVILETVDLHFVRRAREQVREQYLTQEWTSDLYRGQKARDTTLREVASILRVDHAVVLSRPELDLLTRDFDVPSTQVSEVTLVADTVLAGEQKTLAQIKPFLERDGFVWIGNFRHQPNLDGLRWFRAEIWPRIRVRFPGAKINVFGAYPSDEVMSWDKPKDGFFVRGHAERIQDVFESARVNLAPLRFGAGTKGKILEAIAHLVPTVTTKVGSEGITPFPGLEANTQQLFAEACVALHEDETLWARMQKRAVELAAVYCVERAEKQMDSVFERVATPGAWTAQVLRHELLNSHKYFARWIEAKNAHSAK